MYQYSCFATSGTSSNDDILMLRVFNNFQLGGRQGSEQSSKLFRRQCPFYLILPATGKIFIEKRRIVQREIIFNELQSLVIVSDHFLCIFSNDVNLLHLLLIMQSQFFIVAFFVLDAVIFF